jgi:hypothetical protein
MRVDRRSRGACGGVTCRVIHVYRPNAKHWTEPRHQHTVFPLGLRLRVLTGGVLRPQHPLSIVLVVAGVPPLLVRNGRLRLVLVVIDRLLFFTASSGCFRSRICHDRARRAPTSHRGERGCSDPSRRRPDEAVVPVDEPKPVERLTSNAVLFNCVLSGWPDEKASPHRSKARRD